MNIHRIVAPKSSNNVNKQIPKLYKYLQWDYAIDLLERSSLYFSNPRDWSDRYEKKVLDGKYSIDDKKSIPYPLKDRIFATCFTSEYSCEAQWKMYLGDVGKNSKATNIAVEIEFDREKLFAELMTFHKDLYFGEVVYYPQKTFRSFVEGVLGTKTGIKALKANNPFSSSVLATLLRPLLYKRMAYSYEKEWRMFITEELLTKDNHLYIPNLLDCIECIIVDFSKLSESEKNKRESQLLKYVSLDKIRETSLFASNNHVLTFKLSSKK